MERTGGPVLVAMWQVKKDMVAGPDMNVYVEPVI